MPRTRDLRNVRDPIQHRARGSRRTRTLVTGVAAFSAAYALFLAGPILCKQPQHTSILSGHMFMQELLQPDAHEGSFHDIMGMYPDTFWKLLVELQRYGGLRSTRGVTAIEKLGMFLYQLRTSATLNTVKHRFQHSSSTVSNCFHQVLDAVVHAEFYTRYVFPPSNTTPPEVRNNPKFWPWFRDARATTDGSNIPNHVPASEAAANRNRKGWLSQNVLACCSFDMRFTFVLSGWEGSIADGNLWAIARRDQLPMHPGSYLLGDAGFPSCDALLVPYRGVRYHLREWKMSPEGPQNAKELFNLRHASLRNVVERVFGALKRKFPRIVSSPEYSLLDQAKLVSAACAIWNFIRVHDPPDIEQCMQRAEHDLVNSALGGVQQGAQGDGHVGGEFGGSVSSAEKRRADARRDMIAQEMFEAYLQERERRHQA